MRSSRSRPRSAATSTIGRIAVVCAISMSATMEGWTGSGDGRINLGSAALAERSLHQEGGSHRLESFDVAEVEESFVLVDADNARVINRGAVQDRRQVRKRCHGAAE